MVQGRHFEPQLARQALQDLAPHWERVRQAARNKDSFCLYQIVEWTMRLLCLRSIDWARP